MPTDTPEPLAMPGPTATPLTVLTELPVLLPALPLGLEPLERVGAQGSRGVCPRRIAPGRFNPQALGVGVDPGQEIRRKSEGRQCLRIWALGPPHPRAHTATIR